MKQILKKVIAAVVCGSLLLSLAACTIKFETGTSNDDNHSELIYTTNDIINCVYEDKVEQLLEIKGIKFESVDSFTSLNDIGKMETCEPKINHTFIIFSYTVYNTSPSPLSTYAANFTKRDITLYGSDGSFFEVNDNYTHLKNRLDGYETAWGRSDTAEIVTSDDKSTALSKIPSQGWAKYHYVFEVPTSQYDNNKWEIRMKDSFDLKIDGKSFDVIIKNE